MLVIIEKINTNFLTEYLNFVNKINKINGKNKYICSSTDSDQKCTNGFGLGEK